MGLLGVANGCKDIVQAQYLRDEKGRAISWGRENNSGAPDWQIRIGEIVSLLAAEEVAKTRGRLLGGPPAACGRRC